MRKNAYLAFLLLPILLLSWQVLSSSGVINQALFSSPLDVFRGLIDLHSRNLPQRSVLLRHILTSTYRVCIALFLGSVLGIFVGTLIGVSRNFQRFFNPLMKVFMPIPGIAMAPLFIIWLGFGDLSIIVLGMVAAFFPIAYNIAAGIQSIDRRLVLAARIMGANNVSVFLNVYLPWSSGFALNGLKLGLARSWRTIIAVEFIAAASWGLGYMIWDAAEYLRADIVYGGIVLLILVYYLMEKLIIHPLERNTFIKWGMTNQ